LEHLVIFPKNWSWATTDTKLVSTHFRAKYAKSPIQGLRRWYWNWTWPWANKPQQ